MAAMQRFLKPDFKFIEFYPGAVKNLTGKEESPSSLRRQDKKSTPD